jgi:molybdenum cofactor synthesis domain-containing protein
MSVEHSGEEQPREVTACFIVIGNEILSGRTQDRNLAHLAGFLNDAGVRLREARVIPDVPEVIIAAVNECRAAYDYVFTSGGIGPTHDDITAECIARAFGVELPVDPRARAILEAHYPPGELNEARLRMARVPVGGELIENPVSKAPGFHIGNVFVLAGVPAIFQAMLESLRHRITGGAPVLSRTIGCPLPEGTMAGPLGELQARYPGIDIGSYPFYRTSRFGVSVVLRSTDAAQLEAAAGDLKRIIHDLGAEPWEGEQPA